MMNDACRKPVKCLDHILRPCLREKDHVDGHNPFSNLRPIISIGTETHLEDYQSNDLVYSN